MPAPLPNPLRSSSSFLPPLFRSSSCHSSLPVLACPCSSPAIALSQMLTTVSLLTSQILYNPSRLGFEERDVKRSGHVLIWSVFGFV
eukprot:757216-Hanusia_phi.AAC.2